MSKASMMCSDTPVTILTRDALRPAIRPVAIESPVAVEINGLGYAVMMMTPADFSSFAVGFCLSEGLIDTPADLIDSEAIALEHGHILRLTLSPSCAGRIGDRVRHRTSDTSCGLCGIAGLEQLTRSRAVRSKAPVCIDRTAIFAALDSLADHQPLNRATGAVHAAAAVDCDGQIMQVYEDVGRHNALDKLVGALATSGNGVDGFLLVTSRISYEMVDKALVTDTAMLVGVSAPTSIAIAHAQAHGLTLLALARRDAILIVVDPQGCFTPATAESRRSL